MLQVHPPRRETSRVKYCFLANFNFLLAERGVMGSDREDSEDDDDDDDDDGMIEKGSLGKSSINVFHLVSTNQDSSDTVYNHDEQPHTFRIRNGFVFLLYTLPIQENHEDKPTMVITR